MKLTMRFLTLAVVAITVINQTFGAICRNPQVYQGKSVADAMGRLPGECVSFYKKCSGDNRHTSSWRRGAQVKNANIPIGTGIASFTNGSRYVGNNCNRPLPCGHVAIYVGQNSQGIQVWDQWRSKPVGQRTLYFGRGGTSNDGNYFHVIN